MSKHKDVVYWVPWGETIMWGPTETLIEDLPCLSVNSDDVDFLLDELNANSTKIYSRKDIANVRLGTRAPLKKPGQSISYGLKLSRKAYVESHPSLPWHSIFGGKLSGAHDLSDKIYKRVFAEKHKQKFVFKELKMPTTKQYYDNTELPDIAWSVKYLKVTCLEDFLRRRTNIAQSMVSTWWNWVQS